MFCDVYVELDISHTDSIGMISLENVLMQERVKLKTLLSCREVWYMCHQLGHGLCHLWWLCGHSVPIPRVWVSKNCAASCGHTDFTLLYLELGKENTNSAMAYHIT